MNKIIHSIPIDSDKEIRCSIAENEGDSLIDIRIFLKDNEGNFIHSNNGLNISTEFIDDLEFIVKLLICHLSFHAIENSFHDSLKLSQDISDPYKAVFYRGDYIYFKYQFIMAAAFCDYIASKEWSYVKQKVMERDGFSCIDCKTPISIGEGGIIHHEHYDYWGRGDWHEIDSCIFLCKKCHRIRHNKPDMKLKVPFWAKSNSLWDKCSTISEEVLKNAMKNLRMDNGTPSPEEPKAVKETEKKAFQPRLPGFT